MAAEIAPRTRSCGGIPWLAARYPRHTGAPDPMAAYLSGTAQTERSAYCQSCPPAPISASIGVTPRAVAARSISSASESAHTTVGHRTARSTRSTAQSPAPPSTTPAAHQTFGGPDIAVSPSEIRASPASHTRPRWTTPAIAVTVARRRDPSAERRAAPRAHDGEATRELRRQAAALGLDR